MGPTDFSAEAEVVAEVVEIEVAEEEVKTVKITNPLKLKLPEVPSTRAPSHLIYPRVNGQDVESIISTGKMLIFVLNQLLVHGRIFLNQEIEMSTSSVKILHY